MRGRGFSGKGWASGEGCVLFRRVRRGVRPPSGSPVDRGPWGPVGHEPQSVVPAGKGAGVGSERPGGFGGVGGGCAGGERDRFYYLLPPRSLSASWTPPCALSCQGKTCCHSTNGETEGHRAGGTGRRDLWLGMRLPDRAGGRRGSLWVKSWVGRCLAVPPPPPRPRQLHMLSKHRPEAAAQQSKGVRRVQDGSSPVPSEPEALSLAAGIAAPFPCGHWWQVL